MREALWVIIALLALGVRPALAGSLAVVSFGDAGGELAGDVRAAVARLDGVSVLPAKATRDEIGSAAEAGLVCGATSDECLVRLALFAHVDQLVSVAATRSERGLDLELLLVDAALARRTATATASIPDGERRPAAVEDAVLALLVPDRVLGALRVTSTPSGAAIFVDGIESGLTGTSRALRLKKGRHDVEVRMARHRTVAASVDVLPGAETSLHAPLKEDLPPQRTVAEPPAALTPGVVATWAGGVLFVAGGGTAIVIDFVLATSGAGNAESRSNMLTVERVAGVVAAVGALVGIGGVVLLTLEGAGNEPQGRSSAPASAAPVTR